MVFCLACVPCRGTPSVIQFDSVVKDQCRLEAALRLRRGLGRAADSVPLKRRWQHAPSCLKGGFLVGQSHCRLNFFQSAVESCLRHPQFRPSFALENVTCEGFVALRKPAQGRFDHIGRRLARAHAVLLKGFINKPPSCFLFLSFASFLSFSFAISGSFRFGCS